MALPEPPQVVQYQDEAAAVIESGDMRSEKEVEQKIQTVLDTFPHLGDGLWIWLTARVFLTCVSFRFRFEMSGAL